MIIGFLRLLGVDFDYRLQVLTPALLDEVIRLTDAQTDAQTGHSILNGRRADIGYSCSTITLML